jgi:hypothetical protein
MPDLHLGHTPTSVLVTADSEVLVSYGLDVLVKIDDNGLKIAVDLSVSAEIATCGAGVTSARGLKIELILRTFYVKFDMILNYDLGFRC